LDGFALWVRGRSQDDSAGLLLATAADEEDDSSQQGDGTRAEGGVDLGCGWCGTAPNTAGGAATLGVSVGIGAEHEREDNKRRAK
jgi:hypothetical protein